MYMCAPLFSKLVSLAELLLPVESCEGTVLLRHLFCCQGERGEEERGLVGRGKKREKEGDIHVANVNFVHQ